MSLFDPIKDNERIDRKLYWRTVADDLEQLAYEIRASFDSGKLRFGGKDPAIAAIARDIERLGREVVAESLYYGDDTGLGGGRLE